MFLRAFSVSDCAEVKVEALRQQIRLNENDACRQALQAISDGRLDSRLAALLTEAVRYSTAPSAVAALGEVLKSSKVELRRAASYALRHTDSDQGVPLLVAALRDADREVAYNAVMGLWHLEPRGNGKGYAPSARLFDEAPEAYIARWEKWWVEEGKARYDAGSEVHPVKPAEGRPSARSTVSPPDVDQLAEPPEARFQQEGKGKNPAAKSSVEPRDALPKKSNGTRRYLRYVLPAVLALVAAAVLTEVFRRRNRKIASRGQPDSHSVRRGD
jgi:hypothetical protein